MLLKYVVLASALGSILSNDGLVTADKPDILRRGVTKEQKEVDFFASETTAEGSPTTRKLVPAAASYTDGLDDTDSKSTGSPGSSGGKTPGGLTGKGMADIDKMMKSIMDSGSDGSYTGPSPDFLEDDQAKEKDKSDEDANTDSKFSRHGSSGIFDMLDKLIAAESASGSTGSPGSSGRKTPGGLTGKGMADIDKMMKSIMDSGSDESYTGPSPDFLEDDQAKEKDKSDEDANTDSKFSRHGSSGIFDMLDKLIAAESASGSTGSPGSSGRKTPGGLTGKGMADIDKMMKSIMDSGSDESYTGPSPDFLEDDQAKDGWLDDYTDSSAESTSGIKSSDSFSNTPSFSSGLGTYSFPDKKGKTDDVSGKKSVGTETVTSPDVAKPTCSLMENSGCERCQNTRLDTNSGGGQVGKFKTMVKEMGM
ncbi:unnamed protein product [Peronospora destructor]|uniref:Uncharacterized protein n=1 Tax=Peronospora destructor TaxID=86335 RepID=A0AAV0VD87_9STRA|nr:unnamed protein product [Peronospora destructor]